MLGKARLELRRGETETARRLAVEVFNGPYGLQKDAESLLRSIEAEEYAQRRNSANRSFDAALAAYTNRDYTQATAVLREIDRNMLTPDKQSRMADMMRSSTLAMNPPVPAPAPTVQPVQAVMAPPTMPPVASVSAEDGSRYPDPRCRRFRLWPCPAPMPPPPAPAPIVAVQVTMPTPPAPTPLPPAPVRRHARTVAPAPAPVVAMPAPMLAPAPIVAAPAPLPLAPTPVVVVQATVPTPPAPAPVAQLPPRRCDSERPRSGDAARSAGS